MFNDYPSGLKGTGERFGKVSWRQGVRAVTK